MKKKRFDSVKWASKVTEVMATWRFIFIFLAACLLEIVLNVYGILQFDPDTIKLNLMLSLIAAIQGSIIMIDQRQADKKRDALLQKILQLDHKIMKHIKEERDNVQRDRESDSESAGDSV